MGKSSIEEVAEECGDTTKNAGKAAHAQRESEREMGHLVNGDHDKNTEAFRDGPGFHEAMSHWASVFGLKKDD